jgi:hypothetical protein
MVKAIKPSALVLPQMKIDEGIVGYIEGIEDLDLIKCHVSGPALKQIGQFVKTISLWVIKAEEVEYIKGAINVHIEKVPTPLRLIEQIGLEWKSISIGEPGNSAVISDIVRFKIENGLYANDMY